MCLGSNLDNPEIQLSLALERIANHPYIKLLRVSDRIRTAPYGRVMQPDFYNQVVEVESSLVPQLLLEQLLAIEAELGRIRYEKWGPRVIDIDILLVQNTVLDTYGENGDDSLPQLIVPHPDFHNREFALQLLAQLIPDFIHPVMQKSIIELYYLISKPGGKP